MNLFQKYLVEEFAEDFQEGHITRREALKLIYSVTGSMLVTNTILAGCSPTQETAEGPAGNGTETHTQFPEVTDTNGRTSPPSPVTMEAETTAEAPGGTATSGQTTLETGDIEFPGEGATLLGTLSRPSGSGPFAVILVCHENRGLTEHIKDVTRRLARAGYVALAVDLLSRHGGTASIASDEVPGVLSRISPEQYVQDFRSGWRYLQNQDFTRSDRLGMVGFCYGGGVTWQVATQMPELLAAVPFYGPHPEVSEVPKIQAAVLGIYAGNDQRINQGIPAIEEAMRENGKIYEKVIYPGVNHAFHNDTSERYNAEAAQDAWRRTLEWFKTYVG